LLQIILNKYVWIQDSFLQDGELKSALSRENKELSQKKQDKQNEIESEKGDFLIQMTVNRGHT
jgi:hypothetical protein